MPVIKKCTDCNVYMKRSAVSAERNGKIIVLTRFKLFTCPKCDYNEVVEVKLKRRV